VLNSLQEEQFDADCLMLIAELSSLLDGIRVKC
jgi:hypothetical protein